MPNFVIGPIDQRVVYAFLLGFFITFIIMGIRILVVKSRSKKSINELKGSLHSRIELENRSFGNMKEEIETLKNRNENLKTSLQNLSTKAGRREKLQLQVYQTAIEKMSVRAPGFAPAWHVVLKECEDEIGKSLVGTIPFVKRIVGNVGTGWKNTPYENAESTIEDEVSEEDDVSEEETTKKAETESQSKKRKKPSKFSSFISR